MPRHMSAHALHSNAVDASPTAARVATSGNSKRRRFSTVSTVCVALLMLGLTACDNGSVDPVVSPLAGLASFAAADSAGNPPPPPPTTAATPGYFRGTVIGPSASGAGNDSLQTAPRVVGATVRAYPVLGGSAGQWQLGDVLGTATTDANGQFTLAQLPGGNYVVTITPPAGSPYRGVYATAEAHGQSHVYPWWVVLPL